MSKLTLIGAEKYKRLEEKSLFDDILLNEEIDKSTLVSTILLRAGEFELLYSDVDFLKDAIDLFFLNHERSINRWWLAINQDYNPLENYDRIEESIDTNTGTIEHDNTRTIDESNTNTNKVSAFDDSNFVNDSENVNEIDNTITDEMKQTNDTKYTHNARLHGNIGVTQSSEMLENEILIRQKTFYNIVAQAFVNEFCLLVY